jgi:uncharacterized OB-fold protein
MTIMIIRNPLTIRTSLGYLRLGPPRWRPALSTHGGHVAVDEPRHVTESVVAEGEDGGHLIGSRCNGCEAVSFPARSACSRCSSEDLSETLLPPTRTLWGFTIQAFAPKTPYLGSAQAFEPFGVGYVNLADQVLVESRLVATSPDELHNGMPMKLVLTTFAGGHRTYAFAPAASIAEDQP